jgi:hypothetical protein
MILSGSGIAERVNGQLVSGNFFETLGVRAIPGRVLTSEDERNSVCVNQLWLLDAAFRRRPPCGRTHDPDQ